MSAPAGEAAPRSSAAALHASLAEKLAALERQRREARGKTLRALGVIAALWFVAGLPLLFGALLTGGFMPFVMVFGAILLALVSALVWHALAGSAVSDYQAAFKLQVIGRLVRERYPQGRFSPSLGIPIQDFRASLLFRKDIDRYESEDLIEARLGETDFRMSEVHAEYKTTTHTKHGTQTHWHTIFKGLYFLGDFHKSFQGRTLIFPDSAEKILGGLGRKLQALGSTFSDRELVRLESPDFEALFAVYATDQVEARYLLSTSLMERLVDFRRRMDTRVWLSFEGERMHLAIEDEKDRFEAPSLWSSDGTVDAADLAAYLAEVELAESIVEGLHLNTRIWSKA